MVGQALVSIVETHSGVSKKMALRIVV